MTTALRLAIERVKRIDHGRPAAVLLVLTLLAACGRATQPPTPTPPPLAPTLTFYDWEGDMPQTVLDAFTQAYGVRVDYQTYNATEEAIASLQAGQVYDVVVMESRFVPRLQQAGLLAAIDHAQIPNLKNLSANFRELAYDPGNRYSVPYNWGTTGLVVRTDLVADPITHWADLWDPHYRGHVALWFSQYREVLALTLKSLGYSANSENPAQLDAALQRLFQLKPGLIRLEDYNQVDSGDAMASGKVVISMGYAGDMLAGRAQNPAIQYVLPQEGALLWNDTFIIPANSPRRYTAEVFLNFLERPEINAQIANENQYATPNEAAQPFIDPAVLHEPAIFPSNQSLAKAELILPLSPAGQQLYDDTWQRFLAAP